MATLAEAIARPTGVVAHALHLTNTPLKGDRGALVPQRRCRRLNALRTFGGFVLRAAARLANMCRELGPKIRLARRDGAATELGR